MTQHRGPSLRSVDNATVRGFTLLELLVAITLLALLLTAAYAGLRTGSRAWIAGERQADRSERIRVVESFIRRQLGQTYPLTWVRRNKRSVWFRGGPKRLDFAAVLASRALDDGIAFLRLEFVEGSKGLQLVLSCKLAQPEDLQPQFEVRAPDECKRARVLADGLENGEFSYWGKSSGSGNLNQVDPQRDTGSRWRESWTRHDAIPRLIRLTMKTRSGTTLWPQMLIPLHAQVTPGEEQQTIHMPGIGGAAGDTIDNGDDGNFGNGPNDD